MAKCRLWVSNAEIFFVASGHPFAPVIRRTKRNSKKVYFWDTLVHIAKNISVIFSETTKEVEKTAGQNGSREKRGQLREPVDPIT